MTLSKNTPSGQKSVLYQLCVLSFSVGMLSLLFLLISLFLIPEITLIYTFVISAACFIISLVTSIILRMTQSKDDRRVRRIMIISILSVLVYSFVALYLMFIVSKGLTETMNNI